MGKFVELQIENDDNAPKLNINAAFIIGIEEPVCVPGYTPISLDEPSTQVTSDYYVVKIHVFGFGDKNELCKKLETEKEALAFYDEVLQKCKGEPSCES